MNQRIDITGLTFNRWTVLQFVGYDDDCGCSKYICRCTCGTEREVSSLHLRSGATKSCGCLRRETTALKGTRK